MASSFLSLPLFNSGPHRFDAGPVGRLTTAPFRGSNFVPATRDDAVLELTITQTGRLVAASEAALWTLYDAIRAVAEGVTAGTLVDHSGRSWASMRLVSFDAAGPVDRGRAFSLGYRCVYRRFA